MLTADELDQLLACVTPDERGFVTFEPKFLAKFLTEEEFQLMDKFEEAFYEVSAKQGGRLSPGADAIWLFLQRFFDLVRPPKTLDFHIDEKESALIDQGLQELFSENFDPSVKSVEIQEPKITKAVDVVEAPISEPQEISEPEVTPVAKEQKQEDVYQKPEGLWTDKQLFEVLAHRCSKAQSCPMLEIYPEKAFVKCPVCRKCPSEKVTEEHWEKFCKVKKNKALVLDLFPGKF